MSDVFDSAIFDSVIFDVGVTGPVIPASGEILVSEKVGITQNMAPVSRAPSNIVPKAGHGTNA